MSQRRELNPRPLPYQGSALPLSYIGFAASEYHFRSQTPSLDYSTFYKGGANLSGRRGSNPRPTAWKAVALPTELLPLISIFYRLVITIQVDYQPYSWIIEWGRLDSNPFSRKTPDLQSGPALPLRRAPIYYLV